MAVLVIILAIGIPNLRSFIIGTKVSSLSNEFNGALMQTRALAVSRNSCASLCASSNIGSNGAGSCSKGASDNFQRGWLIFENPTCNADQTDPTADQGRVSIVRQGDSPEYSITPSDEALSIVMFDPRGFAAITGGGNFAIEPPAGSDAKFRRIVCVDFAGRSSVRKDIGAGTCS